MTKQITHISVFQTSKVIAVLYALISVLYTLIGIPMFIFSHGPLRVAALLYIFMPVIMLVFGFLFMALFCWLYNVVAKWVGGVEVTVQDK